MDTNGMDTYPFITVDADAVLSVATRHDRMVTVGSTGENPSSGALWAHRGQANDGRTGRLRTSVRCAITLIIAQL